MYMHVTLHMQGKIEKGSCLYSDLRILVYT